MSVSKRLQSGAPYKGAPLTLLGEGILCGQCKKRGAKGAKWLKMAALLRLVRIYVPFNAKKAPFFAG